MDQGALIITLWGTLAAALVVVVITDIKSRTIANSLNLFIACLAPALWWAEGLHLWPGIALQVGMAVIVLFLFMGLFALGMMGGGDVKLLAALALWLPLGSYARMIVLMALLGGLVTLVVAVEHRMRRREGRPEIPYGVAIALAGLWVVGEPYLNHFA